MRKGFLKYEEMSKYFPIYEEAVSHILLCNCSILNFLIYEEILIFFFISAGAEMHKKIELFPCPTLEERTPRTNTCIAEYSGPCEV
jgi:hypothetical protein